MLKILIVEDSKTYNNTLFSLLRKPDFEIFQAFNLKEAELLIQQNEDIDFVLLDLLLPDGEGDELIIKLSHEKHIKAKIIVLTGNKDIKRRNFLFEKGVVDYFSKDVPLKSLAKDINNLLISLAENKNREILIVDDSKFIQKNISNIVTMKNYKTILSSSEDEALEILETNHNISLIFLDLDLDKFAGLKVLEKIKSNTKTKDIPIIILVNDLNGDSYARAIRYGAADFIKKPFLTEEVLLKTDLHIFQAESIKKIAIQAKELEEYKRILNESDMISKTTPKGIITEVNNKFCEVSGYSSDYLIGQSHNVVRHPDMPKKIFKDLWTCIKNKKTFKGIIKNKKRDGTSYYVDATISPIIGIDGNIKEIIGIRHDISDVMNPKKQLIADLSYLENPTLIFLQIANYELFKEFYSETLMHTFEFEFEQTILDYFPNKLGLKKVYNLTNGLYGFLKSDLLSDDELYKQLNQVIEKFKEIGISFKETHYDVDICISFANNDEHILDDVSLGIQHALKYKTSIICAKDFYKRAQIDARNKLKNISIIKDALAKQGSFVSFFQAIMNNHTNKIEKYESLIRLIDKKGNIITPFQFLGLAKKTGYYSNITEIVIQNSFRALDYTDRQISINLSSSDIENRYLRDLLWSYISKDHYKGRVTFELLEDEEVKDFELVKDFILKSKQEGKVKIAIDDFGSGYSNYERLLQFQPDILKIDGSLIKNILTDEYSKHVVESIIVFAKKQKIKTIAEFVSNREILLEIKRLGIDYSQGYYIEEPKRLF